MREHHIKCWPKVFQAQLDGDKGFEYRKNDRNYKKGDVLVQHEWDPKRLRFTGRIMRQVVGYIVYGGVFGIPKGYCIMDVMDVSPKLEPIDAAWGELVRWMREDSGLNPWRIKRLLELSGQVCDHRRQRVVYEIDARRRVKARVECFECGLPRRDFKVRLQREAPLRYSVVVTRRGARRVA